MGLKRRKADALANHSPPSSRVIPATDLIVDPALASLFASSSGPVKIPRITASVAINPTLVKEKIQSADERKDKFDGNDHTDKSSHPHVEEGSRSTERSEETTAEEETNDIQRARKRRRIYQAEDLESSYLNRLAREEAREEVQRQVIQQVRNGPPQQKTGKVIRNVTFGQDEALEGEDVTVPQHETIAGLDGSEMLSKAGRTVFLSNVSTAAIKSKSAKKVLMAHLASPLYALQEHGSTPKVESLRFRSTAFASGVGPKKAAFAKKELMDDTAASTNAYAVYSTNAAARIAASRLNGSIVLDRHLRADYAAQPAVTDHRRCVFVGNLSFVDKESVENMNQSEDSKPRRPRAKEPADAEEGLWRTFSRAGTVENVRVVRDKETRVGKGFAYVQFKDENSVEAALLYNDKKFPPMLPRKLRVMRAKRPHQATITRDSHPDSGKFTTKDRSGSFASGGNRASLTSKSSGGGHARDLRKSNGFVFEGHRASIPRGSNSGDSRSKKRRAVKSSTRSSRRGAVFKAGGGQRKRER